MMTTRTPDILAGLGQGDEDTVKLLRLLDAAQRAFNTLRIINIMMPGFPQVEGSIRELDYALHDWGEK